MKTNRPVSGFARRQTTNFSGFRAPCGTLIPGVAFSPTSPSISFHSKVRRSGLKETEGLCYPWHLAELWENIVFVLLGICGFTAIALCFF
jgi:hypothetical protein